MKKKISIILGVFALILAVGLNVRHAMNDYGVKESKLHIEAMASTAGGDGERDYQSMGYCGGTLNYMCVSRQTAESCRHHCP